MQVAFHQNSQLTAAAPHLHRATNDSKPAVKEARQEIDNVRRPTAMAGIRSASVCLCKNRFLTSTSTFLRHQGSWPLKRNGAS